MVVDLSKGLEGEGVMALPSFFVLMRNYKHRPSAQAEAECAVLILLILLGKKEARLAGIKITLLPIYSPISTDLLPD